jgi:M-phase inducer tyrosine phosphatase
MNARTPAEVRDLFFPDIEHNAVVVFYCELSRNRGPTQAAIFREIDRAFNRPRYPVVFYPEVFVLEGGFRDFSRAFPRDVDGGHRPMVSRRAEREGWLAAGHALWRRGLQEYEQEWKMRPMEDLLEKKFNLKRPQVFERPVEEEVVPQSLKLDE